MPDAALEFQVNNIITKVLKIPKTRITNKATFYGDLQAESLDYTELILRIEETFDIQLREEEIEEINTVEDLINCLRKHLSKTAVSASL